MQDNFSPAAYLQGRIDAPQSEAEIIYINGAFTSDLFTTVAHEGYPAICTSTAISNRWACPPCAI